MTATFDVAISVAAEEAWMAGDIRSLLTEAGYRTYFYGDYADVAHGYLRQSLHTIYSQSAVNVLLWSRHYREKLDDPKSVICQEFYCLVERHLSQNTADALLILCVDQEPMTDLFGEVLFHDLRCHGLVKVRDFTIQRIKNQRLKIEGFLHPEGLQGVRSQCVPCRFRIADNYSEDRLGRWRELGDIAIEFIDFNAGPNIVPYLIPSGAVPVFLRHSVHIRNDPTSLKIKQTVGRTFAAARQGQELIGVRFMHDNKGMEFPHTYCADYDLALLAQGWKTS
jgi:hypothetical protein